MRKQQIEPIPIELYYRDLIGDHCQQKERARLLCRSLKELDDYNWKEHNESTFWGEFWQTLFKPGYFKKKSEARARRFAEWKSIMFEIIDLHIGVRH